MPYPPLTREAFQNWKPLAFQTGSYFSASLQREQPFGYIAPPEWDGALAPETERYPLLILLHGLNSNFREWHEKTRIGVYLNAYKMVVAFADGGNGWYVNGAGEEGRREDDLILDLIPCLQKTLPILPPGKAWGLGGLSMGGYGAVKNALKRPDLFSLAISHSGSLEKSLTPEYHPVFGDPQADIKLRRAESPAYLAEQALCEFPTRRPLILMDCGTGDPFLEASRAFHNHLQFLGYPHEYSETRGRHTWPYWDRALRNALPKIAQYLGAEKREVSEVLERNEKQC